MTTKQRYIQSDKFKNKLLTQRPKTSSAQRNDNSSFFITQRQSKSLQKTQMHPLSKIKSLKNAVKQVQKQYLQLLSSLKQTQKYIHTNYKQAQKKKIDFLKLYQTKKLRHINSSLQKQSLTSRSKLSQQTKAHTKKAKIQQQIKRVIIKTQKQQNLLQLRQKIKSQKQHLKNKKFINNRQLYNLSKTSFIKVKKDEELLKEKKKQIKQITDVRAKHNYWKRISNQIQFLEEYQNVIKELEQYNMPEDVDMLKVKEQGQPLVKTAKTMFMTQVGKF